MPAPFYRLLILAAFSAVALFPGATSAQICNCASVTCCNNNVSVSDIVTERFFNGLIENVPCNCSGKGFYTREAFLKALESYEEFGMDGSEEESKREIAALFAHFTHETIEFCYIEEINGSKNDYCDESNTTYPCMPGKKYYGRGPIQLSWNFNYGPAGESIGFDGLNSPETVAKDSVISFKTALWYWARFVHSVFGNGFGATIRAINGKIECDGGSSSSVKSRVGYYLKYCDQFRVDPGTNLTC